MRIQYFEDILQYFSFIFLFCLFSYFPFIQPIEFYFESVIKYDIIYGYLAFIIMV